MNYFGVTIHEMTPAEAIGFFASLGAVLVGVVAAVALSVRTGRRGRR